MADVLADSMTVLYLVGVLPEWW